MLHFEFVLFFFNLEMDVTLLAKRRVNVRRGLEKFFFILFGPLPKKDYILSTFFPKSDMNPGTQMNELTNLTRTMWGHVFVPRPQSDAVPFSTKNLPELFDHFSMIPGTKEANHLQKLVADCEKPNLIGETKFCATSLESMIDNVVSLLGTRDVQVLTTMINAGKGMARDETLVYKTTTPVKKFPDHTKLVVCHPSPTGQVVHYCHTNIAYRGFIVPLIGNDGSTVSAVTICHHDTVNFNPGFFEVLKMEPGSQPICHFLPENHILWVRTDEMPVLETVATVGSDVHI
jgi:BURP domain